MAKPASAFAPGKMASGQAMTWEALLDAPSLTSLNTVFATQNRIIGAFNVRSLVMIPGNVTRGTVTMLRVRGTIEIYFSSAELAANVDNWPVHMQLQLVPLQDGGVNNAAVLTPSNAADQESNKIIWQRSYYPRAGTTITGPGAVELHENNYIGLEVDIKSKRRFDRANWALVLVVEVETAAGALHFLTGRLRALFAAADGL